MEAVPVHYDREEYIETASGNKVSRKTVLCGSQNIVLNGKVIVQTGAIIRGDLSNVRTGRYCVISQKAVIDEIAETIAILDRVNLNEVQSAENVVTETNTEPLSADISSPLPQNSLETLPSPQSLSSNVTPPNEIEESTSVDLANEDTSSLPPPPPIDDDIAFDKSTEQCGSDATVDVNQKAIDDLLPPPPAQELMESEVIEELKTNGVNGGHSVEAIVGDGKLNGSAKEHDEAANDISDKANGVDNDSEKLNGDKNHKTIEEIVTSPEKLEKLAAANPPPSTEVVAAE